LHLILITSVLRVKGVLDPLLKQYTTQAKPKHPRIVSLETWIAEIQSSVNILYLI